MLFAHWQVILWSSHYIRRRRFTTKWLLRIGNIFLNAYFVREGSTGYEASSCLLRGSMSIGMGSRVLMSFLLSKQRTYSGKFKAEFKTTEHFARYLRAI